MLPETDTPAHSGALPETGRAGEGEMPAEIITSETIADRHTYTRSLHVAWGAKGGTPDAPDGWVNAGFVQVQIREYHGTHGSLTGINIGPDEIDHLIRVLKRVKRQSWIQS